MEENMKKTILCLFLIMTFLTGCACASNNTSPQDNRFIEKSTVEKTTMTANIPNANIGDSIQIKINLAIKEGEKAGGVQFDLVYDSNVLEFAPYDNTDDYFSAQLASYAIHDLNPSEGKFSFIAADLTFKDQIEGTSDIIFVPFKVKGTLSEASLSFENVEILDENVQQLNYDLKINLNN